MRINLYFSEENEKDLIEYLQTKRDPKSYIKDLIFNDKNNIVVTSKIVAKENSEATSTSNDMKEENIENNIKKKVDVKKVMRKNKGMMFK